MEQKIKIEPTVSYSLPKDEQRRLYTYLALSQYTYLRKPDYNEQVLFKVLSADVKRFLVEATNLCEQQPNNLTLNKIRLFFDNHHRRLKEIMQGQ